MQMMSLGLILFSLSLLLCIEQPVNCGQVETQDPNSPSTVSPGRTPTPSGEKIFVAVLPKTADVKKLKAGDTITAFGTGLDGISPTLITFLGRVLEVHALGSGNKDSLLHIRFEKAKFGNNQEVPVHLKAQAIVAPLAFHWSISPIIVDRYPCDYEADPKGCEERKTNKSATRS
jgi:hypothetical protein